MKLNWAKNAVEREEMSYRELYTAANMAGEEYNISDKGLSITPESLQIRVSPGGIAEGQFVVAGPSGTAVTGFLISDSFHLQLRRDSFAENPDRISWRFDAGSLREGETSEGTIGIVTNRGEYRLPFKAEVVKLQAEGKELQEIPRQNAAAARFLSLADEDWGSAVKLFYRKEFSKSLVTDEEKMLYRGLSQYPGNEQNVEEFLIAACGKDPVEFLTDTKEIRDDVRRFSDPGFYCDRRRRFYRGYLHLRLPGGAPQAPCRQEFRKNRAQFALSDDPDPGGDHLPQKK